MDTLFWTRIGSKKLIKDSTLFDFTQTDKEYGIYRVIRKNCVFSQFSANPPLPTSL